VKGPASLATSKRLLAATFVAPSRSTISSICLVAGPVFFFFDERLRDRLQLRRAGVEGGADEPVDRRRLGHRERQREPAKAARRRFGGAQVPPTLGAADGRALLDS
jgi:hypothetical protein